MRFDPASVDVARELGPARTLGGSECGRQMRTMTRAAINSPPLPEPLLTQWRDYLDACESGLRAQYLRLAGVVAEHIAEATPADRASFGRWLCVRLFDDSEGWRGQYGGGGTGRPLEFALANHALVTGVVLPHLRAELVQPDGRALRWLFQALVGLSWRLPPPLAAELRDMFGERFGKDADPIEALRVAASEDVTARRWLADFEEDDD